MITFPLRLKEGGQRAFGIRIQVIGLDGMFIIADGFINLPFTTGDFGKVAKGLAFLRLDTESLLKKLLGTVKIIALEFDHTKIVQGLERFGMKLQCGLEKGFGLWNPAFMVGDDPKINKRHPAGGVASDRIKPQGPGIRKTIRLAPIHPDQQHNQGDGQGNR